MSLCSSEEQEQMTYQGPRVAQLLLSNSPQAGPVEVPGVEHRSPEDLGFAVNAGSGALGFPLGQRKLTQGVRPVSSVSQHQSLLGMSLCTENLPCRISVLCSHHRSEPVLSVPSSSEP